MDQATGLTYMQQRYYDPQVGRFLSVDPMAVETSNAFNFNRYNYANNNPYKFTDPDGRFAGFFKGLKDFFKHPKEQAQNLVRTVGLDAHSENQATRTAAQQAAKPVEAGISHAHQQAATAQKTVENAANKADAVGTVSDATAIATSEVPIVGEFAEGAGMSAHATAFVLDPSLKRAAEVALGPIAKGIELLTGSKAIANAIEGAPIVNEAIDKAAEHND